MGSLTNGRYDVHRTTCEGKQTPADELSYPISAWEPWKKFPRTRRRSFSSNEGKLCPDDITSRIRRFFPRVRLTKCSRRVKWVTLAAWGSLAREISENASACYLTREHLPLGMWISPQGLLPRYTPVRKIPEIWTPVCRSYTPDLLSSVLVSGEHWWYEGL